MVSWHVRPLHITASASHQGGAPLTLYGYIRKRKDFAFRPTMPPLWNAGVTTVRSWRWPVPSQGSLVSSCLARFGFFVNVGPQAKDDDLSLPL